MPLIRVLSSFALAMPCLSLMPRPGSELDEPRADTSAAWARYRYRNQRPCEAGRSHCNTWCGAEMQMCVLIVASETLNVSAIKDNSEIFKKLL